MKKGKFVDLLNDSNNQSTRIPNIQEDARSNKTIGSGLTNNLFVRQFKRIVRKGLNACKDLSELVLIAEQLEPNLELSIQSKEPYQIIAQYLLQELQTIKKSKQMKDKMNLTVVNFFKYLSLPLSENLKNDLNKAFDRTVERNEWFKKVPNMWSKQINSYKCYCQRHQKSQEEKCYKCGRMTHINCFWPRNQSQRYFECAVCYLLYCLPHRPVQKIFFLGCMQGDYRDNTKFKTTFTYRFDSQPGSCFQLRCVRLDQKNRYEISFPSKCTVIAQETKIADFEPLVENTSLKRRNDEVIVIQSSHIRTSNSIYIDQTYTQAQKNIEPVNHLLMIVLTRPCMKPDILRQRFLTKKTKQKSAIIFLKQYIRSQNQECEIEKLKVSLICQFYSTYITYPVRSVHCTHYQPFDLIGLIMCSSKANINVRSWKCPICKKRAYDLRLDEYLFKMIQDNKNLSEVVFDHTGKPIQLKRDEDEPEQEGDFTNIKDGSFEQIKIKTKHESIPVLEDSIINLDDDDVCIIEKQEKSILEQIKQNKIAEEEAPIDQSIKIANYNNFLKRSLKKVQFDEQQQEKLQKRPPLQTLNSDDVQKKRILQQLRLKLAKYINKPNESNKNSVNESQTC